MSQKSKKKTLLTICFVLAFLSLAAAVVFFGTGYIRRNESQSRAVKTISADSSLAIADKIISETGLKSVVRLENDQVSNYYGVPMNIIENSVVYKSTSTLSADEVAVFRISDRPSVDMVTSAIDGRIAECRSSYSTLNTEESTKIENCLVESSGEYIIMVICDDTVDAGRAIAEFYK